MAGGCSILSASLENAGIAAQQLPLCQPAPSRGHSNSTFAKAGVAKIGGDH